MDFIQHINAFSCTFPYKNKEDVALWFFFGNPRFFILLSSFIVITSLIASTPSYASKKSILIITNKSIQRNDQISLNIKKHFLDNENIVVEIHHYQKIFRKHLIHTHPSLIIQLGSKDSKLTFPASTPTLHALIPENYLNEMDLCVSKS